MMRAQPQKRHNEAEDQIRRNLEYQAFRHEQRELGRDPNWIGVHEVRPVLCRCCGEPIPWEVLKGYAR